MGCPRVQRRSRGSHLVFLRACNAIVELNGKASSQYEVKSKETLCQRLNHCEVTDMIPTLSQVMKDHNIELKDCQYIKSNSPCGLV